MSGATEIQESVARRADWLDEIHLALHAAIAAKLRRKPQLLGIALQNLRFWKQGADAATRAVLKRWKLILLTSTTEEIADFLVARSAEAARMRCHSPFCGVLSAREQQQALLPAD